MSFSDSLTKLMESTGTTNVTLGKAIGSSDVAVLRWRRGDTSPKLDDAVKIAKYFGVSLDEISELKKEVDIETFTRIPVLGDVSAGSLEMATLLDGRYLTINSKLLVDYPREECFALHVNGDSMEPEFPNHSYVIVHQQSQCIDGDYVIVLNENTGENTFKKFKRYNDHVDLIPLNEKYKTMVFKKQDINVLKIQGVVINSYYRL